MVVSLALERNQPHIRRGDGAMVGIHITRNSKTRHDFHNLVVGVGAVYEAPNNRWMPGRIALDPQIFHLFPLNVPAVIIVLAIGVLSPSLALLQRKSQPLFSGRRKFVRLIDEPSSEDFPVLFVACWNPGNVIGDAQENSKARHTAW